MKSIVTIVGARPQFIKASVVSDELAKRSDCKEILIHTGQHYDEMMSDVFFQELGVKAPDYQLNIGSGTHGYQTARMLESIEKILIDIKPDWVLVYGDTNSTLAGALAAAKLQIPIAHVEAGLRSWNRSMPEEINRVMTDHLSSILLTPTQSADENLIAEGIPSSFIHRVGDVMYDVCLRSTEIAYKKSRIIEQLDLKESEYILATIHRAETTDNELSLRGVFEALCEITSDYKIVLPLHPRTRNALMQSSLMAKVESSLMVVEPVGYLDMLMLEKNARLIITDSGGVQKEGFFHKVPVVTTRSETEWTELVDLGWNRLVST